MAELYDGAASGWQAGIDRLGFDAAYENLTNCALTYQPIKSAERILDAGAGTGAAARMFATQSGRSDCQFDLLDPSKEMLAQAVQNIRGTTRAVFGALGEPALAQQQYDRVLCAHVIEHCPDPQAQINWLFRRLHPNGTAVFAISKPHWCTALVRWRWGNSSFHPTLVRGMLETAGFTNIEICRHPSGPPSRVSCGYLARRPT
ncbi:MAG: class I SAM-dependent methyltransferase [Paracoccaceae bacterium]